MSANSPAALARGAVTKLYWSNDDPRAGAEHQPRFVVSEVEHNLIDARQDFVLTDIMTEEAAKSAANRLSLFQKFMINSERLLYLSFKTSENIYSQIGIRPKRFRTKLEKSFGDLENYRRWLTIRVRELLLRVLLLTIGLDDSDEFLYSLDNFLDTLREFTTYQGIGPFESLKAFSSYFIESVDQYFTALCLPGFANTYTWIGSNSFVSELLRLGENGVSTVNALIQQYGPFASENLPKLQMIPSQVLGISYKSKKEQNEMLIVLKEFFTKSSKKDDSSRVFTKEQKQHAIKSASVASTLSPSVRPNRSAKKSKHLEAASVSEKKLIPKSLAKVPSPAVRAEKMVPSVSKKVIRKADVKVQKRKPSPMQKPEKKQKRRVSPEVVSFEPEEVYKSREITDSDRHRFVENCLKKYGKDYVQITYGENYIDSLSLDADILKERDALSEKFELFQQSSSKQEIGELEPEDEMAESVEMPPTVEELEKERRLDEEPIASSSELSEVEELEEDEGFEEISERQQRPLPKTSFLQSGGAGLLQNLNLLNERVGKLWISFEEHESATADARRQAAALSKKKDETPKFLINAGECPTAFDANSAQTWMRLLKQSTDALASRIESARLASTKEAKDVQEESSVASGVVEKADEEVWEVRPQTQKK